MKKLNNYCQENKPKRSVDTGSRTNRVMDFGPNGESPFLDKYDKKSLLLAYAGIPVMILAINSTMEGGLLFHNSFLIKLSNFTYQSILIGGLIYLFALMFIARKQF